LKTDPALVALRLSPADSTNPDRIKEASAQSLGCSPEAILEAVVKRRSIDARKGAPVAVLQVEVYRRSRPAPEPATLSQIPAQRRGRALIIGAGPAGYFAALECLLLGLQPVILERGKDARARRYDLRAVMQDHKVNPHSNYCFGEGGAGTYSDGKLYTRSDKRGDVPRLLRMLVEHGARSEILVDAHPHIGSNRLPGVVERLRDTLLHYGAEIHFDAAVTDFLIRDDRVTHVLTADGREFSAPVVVLATGHSARDVYELLHRRGILLEPKSFAVGVRVEHPQTLIDQIQYRCTERDPSLPAASYRLVCQVSSEQSQSTGVYSFCMCPGGLIVPAATSPEEIVVNGMSMSGRNSRWANSGIVAEVQPVDLAQFESFGPLAGIAFQRSLEQAAFQESQSLRAPASRLTDFLDRRLSQSLPRSSHVPGLFEHTLEGILPERILECLRHGFTRFGKMMPGFMTAEAIVVGVETRTSSPVRIPRDREGLFHPQIRNLYPCGEGAGFAGGIVSAALDGQRVARAAASAFDHGP
jgi:uncharacterized FAD-dependent dehydrogenase